MKYKMLMFGPGHGHNIEPWLEYLNEQDIFEVDFLCSNFNFSQEQFSKINVIEIGTFKRISFRYLFIHLRQALNKKYHCLYIHDNHGYDALIYILFVRSRVKIYNVWSEHVIETTRNGNILDRIKGYLIFLFSDYIFANWYGTKEKLENYFPQFKHKIKYSFWGIKDIFFKNSEGEINVFTRTFLESIPIDKIVTFWPKSFISCNRHDLVIMALGKLKIEKEEILENYLLYLWGGNVEESDRRKQIEELIVYYELKNTVCIIDHPYVPYSDIRKIQQRSDFSIHFGDTDQLSSSIIEPIMLHKDIILSNIQPYQFLNSVFDMDIQLIDNEVDKIAQAISNKISSHKTENKGLLEKRAKIFNGNDFKFSNNVNVLLHFIKSQIEKSKQSIFFCFVN